MRTTSLACKAAYGPPSGSTAKQKQSRRGIGTEIALYPFDDTSLIEPVGDIRTRSAQPWIVLPAGRLQVERQPTDYAPFFDRFRAQGHFR